MESLLPFIVFLNHFYVTVDSTTYRAIQNSTFLQEQFAPYELRATKRTDISYTGQYFYGTNTYFEFFDANDGSGSPLGSSGIALGVEEPGGIQALANLWQDSVYTITRGYEGKQVPWFYMAGPADFSDDKVFLLWAMEYIPAFLPAWHPDKSTATGISRQAQLDRYKAIIKPVKNPILKDVIEITVAFEPTLLEKFKIYGKQCNYKMTESENKVVLQGPDDVKITLLPSKNGKSGIQEVVFKTNRSPKQKKHSFGHTVLRFKKDKAIWTF